MVVEWVLYDGNYCYIEKFDQVYDEDGQGVVFLYCNNIGSIFVNIRFG